MKLSAARLPVLPIRSASSSADYWRTRLKVSNSKNDKQVRERFKSSEEVVSAKIEACCFSPSFLSLDNLRVDSDKKRLNPSRRSPLVYPSMAKAITKVVNGDLEEKKRSKRERQHRKQTRRVVLLFDFCLFFIHNPSSDQHESSHRSSS